MRATARPDVAEELNRPHMPPASRAELLSERKAMSGISAVEAAELRQQYSSVTASGAEQATNMQQFFRYDDEERQAVQLLGYVEEQERDERILQMRRQLRSERVAYTRSRLKTILRKGWCVIDPRHNQTILVWDVVTGSACLFTAIVTPYEVGFMEPSTSPSDGLFILNQLITVIFFFDMIINFNLAYRTVSGAGPRAVGWVTDPVRIMRHYLGTWFFIDFISIAVSAFDFMAVCFDTEANCAAKKATLEDEVLTFRVLRTLRALRLLKLFRVLRASRIFQRWETSVSINYAQLEMVLAVTATFFCCHWFACIWGLQATLHDTYLTTWLGDLGYCVQATEPTATHPMLQITDVGGVASVNVACVWHDVSRSSRRKIAREEACARRPPLVPCARGATDACALHSTHVVYCGVACFP